MPTDNKIYDVAIIGAGPGGSTLSYLLAKAGFEVCLIDKDIFPRKKVCAGGLPVKVMTVVPVDIASVVKNRVSGVSISFRGKNEFSRHYDNTLIYTVDRREFDNRLLNLAREAGAIIFEGNKVEAISYANNIYTTITAKNKIFSRIVVGADGANGVTARSIGLTPSNFRHVALQVEVPIERFLTIKSNVSGSILLDWGSVKDGYGWVFPNGDYVSLGVMVPSRIGNSALSYQRDWMRHFGLNIDEFALYAHNIPHRVSSTPIVKEALLLIGDAAGLADFWTGEGIYYAIKSARLAAGQIEKYLKGDGAAFSEYQNIIDRDILPELQASYKFSRLFNHVSPLAFHAVRKYSYPWDLFCRIMRGDRTFHDVRKKLRPDIILRRILKRRTKLDQ